MLTTSTKNLSPQRSTKQGNHVTTGSPVQACIQLTSCLTPVKPINAQFGTPTANPVSVRKNLKLDERPSPFAKDVAIFLEKLTVEQTSNANMECNISKTNIQDLKLECPPMNIDEMQVGLGVSKCPPQENAITAPLWCTDLVDVAREWENVYQNKIIEPDKNLSMTCSDQTPDKTPNSSHSSMFTAIDVDLTPPASTDSASTSSLDSEANSPQQFFDVEESMEKDSMSAQPASKPESSGLESFCDSLCTELEVRITRIEPTLHQLHVLYQQNKYHPQNTFRDSYLRPKQTLRQFVPFAIEHSKSRCRRKCKNIPVTKTVNNKKRRKQGKKPECRAELFGSTKKGQLKEEQFKKQELKFALKQKKEAFKFRNKYENALHSINQRLMRQNYFWKTFAV